MSVCLVVIPSDKPLLEFSFCLSLIVKGKAPFYCRAFPLTTGNRKTRAFSSTTGNRKTKLQLRGNKQTDGI